MTPPMNDHLRNLVVNLKVPSKGTRVESDPSAPVILSTRARKYPAEAPTRMFVTPTGTTRQSASVNWSAHPQEPKEKKVTLLSPVQMIVARVISAYLIPMMLISPLARVYAEETVVADVPAEAVVQPAPTQSPTPTVADIVPLLDVTVPAVVEAVDEAGGGDNTQSETPPAQAEVPLSDTEVGGVAPPVVSTVGEAPAEVAPGEDREVEMVAEEYSSTTIPLDGAIGTEENTDATSTDVVLESGLLPSTTTTEVIIETGATTTDENIIEAVQPADNSAEIEAERSYQEERMRTEMRKEIEQEFLRGCITFEASGYYCLNNESRSTNGGVKQKKSVTVTSEAGEGGDKEIFVLRDGERTLLTVNEYDDTFPTQDVTGEHFVWQGMKGGRWQIFTGEIATSGRPIVTQVTDSRDSNFNPKIDGDNLVWQGWADNNWEIFLASKRDAKSPFAGEHLPEGNALLGVGPEWSVLRLTANTDHDMFPSLHGDLVTWQSREGADWVVYAYSISAKKQTKLSSDGVKSENPKFSITWEERDQEGNARLVGYDLSTGQKTDLTSESMRLPSSSFPEPAKSPISQPDPAALPVSQTSGSSTPSRGDDEGSPDNSLLP